MRKTEKQTAARIERDEDLVAKAERKQEVVKAKVAEGKVLAANLQQQAEEDAKKVAEKEQALATAEAELKQAEATVKTAQATATKVEVKAKAAGAVEQPKAVVPSEPTPQSAPQRTVSDPNSPLVAECKTCKAKCKSDDCRSWCDQQWCSPTSGENAPATASAAVDHAQSALKQAAQLKHQAQQEASKAAVSTEVDSTKKVQYNYELG